MKKIYKLIVLAVLLCCGTSLWAVQSLPYSYGFEDYDLSTDGWTKYFGTSITKNNNECAIVGDAKKTGSYGFRFCSYNTSGANAQYLISPELDAAAGLDLTFWYKASDSRGTEKFKVGYSTTDADVANFTWGEENSTNSTSWLKFEGSFPAGTKYVAIYYYANYQYRLYVDDFEFVGKAEGPALQVLDGLTKITSGHNYSFGLATAGSVKMFTMNNPGTEAATITVSHTGDFTVTPSTTISIPAGESSALAIYMPETSGSDVITISSTAESIDDFVINVSGTVREASKMWCNFSEGLPEGWTNSSYTINTTGAGAGTSDGGYAGNTNYSSYRLSTPKVAFAENEKMFLLVAGSSSYSTGTVQIQYSADGTNWTDAKTVSSIAYGSWTNVEVTEIPAGTYYIGFYGKYYYLTDIYGGTPVAMPKNVAAAGVTDTEATISWTAHGSETAWQVSYSTTSGDPNNGTIVGATSTSKVLEGLSASTTYYVSVRIGNSGEWSNEISFKTGCAALSGSWSLNFDELASGQIPECWDNSGSTSATYATTPSYFWAAYKYSYTSDAKMLIMNNTLIKAGTAVINTPRIELPASPAYEFNFEYSHKADCGAFTVNVSEDGGANWKDLGSYTNETGGTAGVPADLIEASIDLTDYAGKTIILQFYAMANYKNGAIFVDNVALRVKSNCPLPKNVTVSSVTDHTAKVAWTEKGEATAWKLQTSTDGENWGEDIDANTNPFTLTGLTAETTYYVRVKSACGESEYSDWSDASAAFTTQCEARTLPFATEGFDAIPECWSVDPEWELYSYDGSIRVKSYTASLTMPLIVLSEKAQLSFRHSAGSNNSVKYCVYVNDGESEEKAEEMYSSTSWKQATVDLSAYIGKTVNIIFRSSSSSYYLYLDDVAVNYLPVKTPTDVVATPADESAVVTWESEEATYALRYRTNGEGDWTEVTGLNAKTYTIESLTNGTAYEVQVKAVASAKRQSDWTASTVVTPAACPTITGIELSEKTFNSVKVSWTTSGVGTWDLSFQQGTTGWSTPTGETAGITGTSYTLTDLEPGKPYYIKVKPSCGDDLTWVQAEGSYTPLYTAPTNVVVTNISDVAAIASWDAVADMTGGYEYAVVPRGTDAGTWANGKITTKTSVELTGLAAGTEYDFHVVSLYPGKNTDYTMSPDVKVEFATITVAPKSISVSEITASSAKLTWENEGAATTYEYAVGNDPDALAWNEVTEKTKTLSELEANTSYTFYVRAKYSDKVKSDSVNITFRTDCNAIAELPWFEGFEDMAVGNYKSAAPACWAQLHVNDGLPYAYVNNTSYVKTGSKSMYVVSSSLTDGYLILPAFEAALNGLQISFSHKEESATRSTVLTLGYITDIANAETFVAVKEFGRATSWQEEKEISLAGIPNEVAATARLAFKLGKATDQYYTGIDDITVAKLPSCRKPVLGETTILPDGASFTWTAGGGETKFQYAVGNDPDALEWKATEVTEATVHGLVPGNNYKFYVRAFCDPEVSDSVWTAFAPVCNAPTEAALTTATTNTASFSWTAAANITSYQYVVMAKGVAADWSKAKTTTNTTAEWTELAANTAYDFYVRSYFNETVQSAAASLSFRTECAAVAALPWSENFEDQTLNAAPACWEVVDPNNTNIYVSTGSTWFSLGTTGLFFEGAKANYGYILLPEFEAALNTLQISFSHSEESSSSSGKIELGYYKDGEFTSLKAYDQSQKAWKAEGPFALTDVPADARLAFGYKTNSNTYAAAIDNITIEEIPACAVPTGLAASEVTAATATLSWTSEAANFKVQYTTDKGNWGEDHAVAAKTLTLEGLTEQTTYYARVKAICGEASESEYCAEISFTTPCAAKAMPYAESFEEGVPACWETTGTWTTNSEYAHSGNALRADVKNKVATLTMPAIAISEADAELVFYVRNVYNGYYYVSGEVIITPTVGEAKHVAVINSNDINNKQKVDLSEFNGKAVVISFSITSVSSTAYVYIDDVTVAKKQCATPTDVKVTKGDSRADVEWTAGEEETEWQVRYKATAVVDWKEVEGTIATTSYNITGLVNGTEYEVQVRAYCDETHQSAWTESVKFTPSEATGFENINGGEKAIKRIINGQLIIEKNGKFYNATGAEVK